MGRLRWHAALAWHQLSRLFASVLRWLRAFRQRQSIRYLLLGLPALLAAIGVGVIGFMIFVDPVEMRVFHYRGAGVQALRDKNLSTAEVAYERLAMMDESQPEYRYRLALTVQAMSEQEMVAAQKEIAQQHEDAAKAHRKQAEELFNRTRAMMGTLAIPDKQGYAPAHIWWARILMAQAATPDTIQLAEKHLRRALQINTDDVDANQLLGQLYMYTGQLKTAETHLLNAARSRPGVNLTLAEMYRRQGARDLARLHAEKAQRFFRPEAQADIDNNGARIGWAQATMYLEDFPTAVGILQEGARLSGASIYNGQLSRAYVAWAESLARNPKAPVGERLALLERAVQLDFGNLNALVRLAAITKTADEASAEKARAALRVLLAEGKSPAIVHLLLGMDAQAHDKVEEARLHYEQAYKLSPQTPVVVNNLAWALAHSEKPDLKEALNLINTVLQRAPNQLRFRETRGQILAKMGQYEEALPDLEAALRVLNGHADLHRTLAETYRKLGKQDMAAEHERLAGPATPVVVPGSETKPDETPKPKPDEGKPADPKSGAEKPKPTDK